MKVIFIFLLLSISTLVQGQTANPDMEKQTIKDALVELALKNYPSMHVKAAQVDRAERNLNYTHTTWTQQLRVFYNLNDQMLANGQSTLPMFGLGLSISVGDIISLPSRTKIAKAEIHAAEGELELQEVQIKREVLTRYNNYLTALELLKLKTEELEEATVLQNTITQQFNSRQVSLEDYTRAAIHLSEAKEEVEIIKNNFKNAELAVEEMIGVDLEELLKRFR